MHGPSPDLVRGPSPDLVRGPSPDLVRGPSPDLVRGPSPDLVRGPSPDLVRGPSPADSMMTSKWKKKLSLRRSEEFNQNGTVKIGITGDLGNTRPLSDSSVKTGQIIHVLGVFA